MLNALDNLPEDPVELRRVTELLASEVKAQALMIEKLQHQLHGANRHRFGSKSEGMDQLQLFAENEEIAEAAVKAAETAPAAGNRLSSALKEATLTVHPRVCGEQAQKPVKHHFPNGSSPRVRGTVHTGEYFQC